MKLFHKTVYEDSIAITDGTFTVPADKLANGTYNVTVSYTGDNRPYKSSETSEIFTVYKNASEVTVNVTDIYVGVDEVVNFTVTDGATGTVSVVVKDSENCL